MRYVKRTPLLILLLLLLLGLIGTNMHVVNVSLAQADQDIAITKVTPSAASVRLGSSVNITVVIENQGTATENSTASLYYDTNTIETKPVTNLQPAQNTTLVFTWNTTNLREEIYAIADKEKSYAIRAVAAPLLGETETQDNELTSPTPITVLMHYIAIIPERTLDTSITPGKNYTIAVYTDYNGTDIWSWSFRLSYNPVFLEGIKVTNGDLITTAKHPNATFVAGSFNNTIGRLSLTLALIEYQPPIIPTTSGPGTLAYVTFRVKETGESNITLIEGAEETVLFGPSAEAIINYFTPSLNHLLYGSFSNTEIQAVHDVAVVSVTPSPTVVTVGETINIAVVVENQGTITEVFDVVLYYDYDPPMSTPTIGQPQTVLGLAPTTQKTLSFTWNTTNLREKNYTLTAVVPGVSGETDNTDNKLQSSQTVTIEAKEFRPLPIKEIIIVIVVAIAVIAAIVILRRRRKKPTAE